MKIKNIILLSVATIFLYSCGNEHKAKILVEDFLDKNLVTPEYSVEEYSKMDSTFYINDSIVNAMRNNVSKSGIFKTIDYGKEKNTRKLLFIHIKFKNGTKIVKQTFYMDDQLTRVISLKND